MADGWTRSPPQRDHPARRRRPLQGPGPGLRSGHRQGHGDDGQDGPRRGTSASLLPGKCRLGSFDSRPPHLDPWQATKASTSVGAIRTALETRTSGSVPWATSPWTVAVETPRRLATARTESRWPFGAPSTTLRVEPAGAGAVAPCSTGAASRFGTVVVGCDGWAGAIRLDARESVPLGIVGTVDSPSIRLPKLRGAGSNPVSRSSSRAGDPSSFSGESPAILLFPGAVRSTGLAIRATACPNGVD
jgi:hypothetical protein